MSNEEELLAGIHALIGSHGTPQAARDPVNQPAIRNWCDAIGIANPRYIGAVANVVAPAAMLCTWTMPGNIPMPEDPLCPRAKAFALLRQHGYSGLMGTSYEEECLRPLRLGELLSGTVFLTGISERKKTGLGEGYFLTTRTEFANQAGEPIGSWTFRMLAFQPRPKQEGAGQGAKAASAEPAPKPVTLPTPERRLSTRRFDEVAVGDELPPWTIPVTPRLVIAGATATRDFSDIHIDAAEARRVGLPNIILNSLTSSGLCSRYAEDWAGPEVEQKNIRLRLGTPCVVGDCLTFSATVAAKEAKGARGLVTLNVVGKVSSGDHLGGTLDLELPI